MFTGNCQVLRFRLNNLVVASVGAVASVNNDVTITALPASMVGCIGIAIPTEADMLAGMLPPIVRLTSTTNLRLRFVNPSAGALDLADTHDWDVYLFVPSGQNQQTI